MEMINNLFDGGRATWYLLISALSSFIGIASSGAILYQVHKRASGKRLKKRKESYLSDITTREYIDWELNTLKALYPENNCCTLTTAEGRQFPVITKLAADGIMYSPDSFHFDGFSTELKKDYIETIDRGIRCNKLPQYRRFHPIVSDQVRYPDLIGYANTKIKFDDKGRVCGFVAQPRSYKETVYSCHVLQYELWETFRKKKRVARMLHRNEIPQARLEELPLRNMIHNGELITKTIGKGKSQRKYLYLQHKRRRLGDSKKEHTNCMWDTIFGGINRSSLCDVNIAILKKEKKEGDPSWSIALGRRSTNVATFPGYWSIVPSGSFEMSEKMVIPKNKNNPLFLKKLEKNSDIILALFREYLEEVFNESDYEHPNGDDDINKLKENKHIQSLKDACSSGQAKFMFLGACFNLVVLRQTFSFALIINDDSMKQLQHNDENVVLEFMPLQDLQQLINAEDALMVELAGTYNLLKENAAKLWPNSNDNPFLQAKNDR